MAYGVNAPFGFQPLNSIAGGVWTEKTNVYRIASNTNGSLTYATSIFQGDPVIWNPTSAVQEVNSGNGSIAPYGSTADTTATPIIGVFSYCTYIDIKGNTQRSYFWPASTPIYPGTTIKAYVVDDPLVVWSVQVSTPNASAIHAAWTSRLMGTNVGITFAGTAFTTNTAGVALPLPPQNPASGNTQTGVSAYYVAGAATTGGLAPAAALTLPFKVIGFDQNEQNLAAIKMPVLSDGTFTPADPLGVSGGYFLNVVGIFNGHAYNGTGTAGTIAG